MQGVRVGLEGEQCNEDVAILFINARRVKSASAERGDGRTFPPLSLYPCAPPSDLVDEFEQCCGAEESHLIVSFENPTLYSNAMQST